MILISHKLSILFKVCDMFSGKPLKKISILCNNSKIKYIEKEFGFYVISDIDNGIYTFVLKLDGYKSKEVVVDVNYENNSYVNCFLVPSEISDGISVQGKININGEDYINKTIYYSFESMQYKGVVSQVAKKDDKHISFHIYNERSMEGRKFAFNKTWDMFSIGSFDYVENKYKLNDSLKRTVNKGRGIYFIYEDQTNENGNFNILLPKFIFEKNNSEILFFLESKCIRKNINITKKELYIDIDI